MARPELWIGLTRNGSTIECEHQVDHNTVARFKTSIDWVGANGERRNLEELGAMLDRGNGAELLKRLMNDRLPFWGEGLFLALFGEEGNWEPVMRELCRKPDGPRPQPPRIGVQVKIHTTDALLSGLPWRAVHWKGRRLTQAGWTFEVAPDGPTEHELQLPPYPRVLVLAPKVSGLDDLSPDTHIQHLREKLGQLSDRYLGDELVTVVERASDIAEAVKALRPDVLYYFGHGQVESELACLVFGRKHEETLSFSDLLTRLAGHPPTLAILNACKSGGGGWLAAGHQLTSKIPVVLSQRTTAWSEHATETALRWFSACLIERRDPVEALNGLEFDSTRDFQWATTLIHTNYRHWKPRPVITHRAESRLGLWLDRVESRGVVLNHVHDLARSEQRRVVSFVTHASPENMVALFAEQVLAYLESTVGERIVVRRVNVKFPDDRAELHKQLNEELVRALSKRHSASLEQLLRAAAATAGKDVTSVLWLDWGVHGVGDPEEIKALDLRQWLEFCAEALTRHCPEDLRLVTHLGLNARPKSGASLEELLRKIQKLLDKVAFELNGPVFHCQLVPALQKLGRLDILDYLTREGNTTCPPHLTRELADLIHQASDGGAFDKTLELFKQAEAGTWGELRRRLLAATKNAGETEETF
jgi:hypothetical protein